MLGWILCWLVLRPGSSIGSVWVIIAKDSGFESQIGHVFILIKKLISWIIYQLDGWDYNK